MLLPLSQPLSTCPFIHTTTCITKSLAIAGNKYQHLTPEEADHFLTKGWLHVPNAIKPEYIERWMKDLWTRIDYDENDKSGWKESYHHLPRHREVPAEEFAPEAWKKTIDICGGEHNIDPVRERYYGDAFIINFGTEELTKQEPKFEPRQAKGWHTDDDWYRCFLDSTGNALTVIHVFSDIPENGGGTAVCEDGIEGVVKYLYDHPEGLDPPIAAAHCVHVPQCKQFRTITAKKGDVILLHGLLPHTASPNFLHYARVISNPHVSLHSPHNLNRKDGDYVRSHPAHKLAFHALTVGSFVQTLLEQVILRGLGRDSVPEFQPTRERKYWYPRNAGFKRAKAEGELKRMVAAAKEKGLEESSVDSLYQRRGTQEFADFERRNGFDKEVNSLLMEQHRL
ncbi:hypothetical protein HII31_05864 [Pseudocercospora fuligena]|uniref:Uncharacterized protein n=1 Tax=Pseudocercospora fuligena TaxID=685502 RepID=A0A8H6RMH4_9PEZI|nr:hypothetical protein HII31_05864 [Pseudocercospora fuligena]